MKEFNKLMAYRSYYEYDFDCEVVRVIDGEEHDAAKELYAHIVKNYFLKDDDKWAFDIALDCVHNFTDEEVGIVQRQGEIGDYHLLHTRDTENLSFIRVKACAFNCGGYKSFACVFTNGTSLDEFPTIPFFSAYCLL